MYQGLVLQLSPPLVYNRQNLMIVYAFIRHILAVLHFNENIHREPKKSKDGRSYYHVTYPKFKLGDEVVREIPVPSTYGESCFYSNGILDFTFQIIDEVN